VKSLFIALVIWIFLRALLVEGFHITSGSMEPTLLIGDVLFVNKAIYGPKLPIVGLRLPGFRGPRRGDVVIFDSVEESDLTVIKRIVGMPGDTVAMKDGVTSINGVTLHEPHVQRSVDGIDAVDRRMTGWQARYLVGDEKASYRPSLYDFGPLAIPPDSFLVLGDNRGQSYDSRYWGFLGRDRIRGRALIIYYSYDKNGILPLPLVTSIRWGRLLRPVR
jgi:signal peptidase I